MGGLVIKVKDHHKRIHIKGEAGTWRDRQKEAHSRGNVEDEVAEDEHHGGGPCANMGVRKWPRTWLLTGDSSGGAVPSNMTQKVAAMAMPVNMAGVSG